jgi:hypothetical protein
MNAKRSAAVLLSSPAAAQRYAEGAGLEYGAVAASTIRLAADRCTTEADFHWRRRIDADPPPAVKLHLQTDVTG